MARMVSSSSVSKPSLDRPPTPGRWASGFSNTFRKLAWQQWLRHPNHADQRYRLTPFQPKARQFWKNRWSNFFFGEGTGHRATFRHQA